MNEQKESHDGGNYWVGRGGKSPFGVSGSNLAGIRIGSFSSSHSAIKVAERRSFREYRSDRILDTRQIHVALRKLRKLNKIGAPDVLNLRKTLEKAQTFNRPFWFSELREICEESPACVNWWGTVTKKMKAVGFVLTGKFRRSKTETRKGGLEMEWWKNES